LDREAAFGYEHGSMNRPDHEPGGSAACGAAVASELRAPDFFFIGAPRCGTTALCKHLARHPHVRFSKPYEPHYFSQLTRSPTPEEVRRDYLEPYFAHCTAKDKAVGERSVSYFFSEDAVRYVLDVFPDAKFVASIRNPVDFVYSYHARTLFNMDEDVTDFETAWRLQEARARGEKLPRMCRHPGLLQYREIAALGTHLERLFEVAGRERCHVVVFDDFKADPGETYRHILDFLGLAHDGRWEIPRKQVNKTYRFHWLQRLIYRPPNTVAKAALNMERRSGKKRSFVKRLSKRLKRWNVVPVKRVPLREDLRLELTETFRGEVDKLTSLLDRDLSSWSS